MRQGDARRGRLFVALAAVAWSTAGLFQRELTVNLGTQLLDAPADCLGSGVDLVQRFRVDAEVQLGHVEILATAFARRVWACPRHT